MKTLTILIAASLFFSTMVSFTAAHAQTSETPEGLKDEEIQKVLKAASPSFKRCYEPSLKSNPDLAGVIALQFTIISSGAVKEVEVLKEQTTLNETKTIACVRKHVSTLKFPAPRGGGFVTITYPLSLSSSR